MTNHTGMISIEYDTELLRSIRQFAIYDKDKTRQRGDWSYTCDLHKIQHWIVKTDRIVCGIWERRDRIAMWPII